MSILWRQFDVTVEDWRELAGMSRGLAMMVLELSWRRAGMTWLDLTKIA